MIQMAFHDLSHTFHKQVTNVSQHDSVILLAGGGGGAFDWATWLFLNSTSRGVPEVIPNGRSRRHHNEGGLGRGVQPLGTNEGTSGRVILFLS